MNSILNKTKNKLNKNVLITNNHDVYYLTRFTSSNLTLMLINGEWYALTDPRYLENAKNSIEGVKVIDSSKQGWMDLILSENEFSEIYVNDTDISIKEYEILKEAYSTKGIEVKTFNYGFLRDGYLEEDIARMKRSSKLNDDILQSVMKEVKVGMTEKDVRAIILKKIVDSEAEAPSFEPIIGAGPSGSNPHWQASDRVIQANEMLTIDMGVFLEGWASDMTRTFVVEGEVSEEEVKIWNVVKEAMERCIEIVKPGVTAKELHELAVEIIDSYGYKEYFTHALGHGVGIEIHEQISLSTKSTASIEEGMVITIEPGIYIPGKYGVRLEQAVLVTKEGYEILNSTPVELNIN